MVSTGNKVLTVMIGNVICLGLGWSIGSNGNAPPGPEVVTKTEIVRIPEVITHVETREVVKPAALPDSCRTAVSLLLDSGPDLNAASDAAGDVSLALKEAGIGSVMADITHINTATERFNKARELFDTAAVNIGTESSMMKRFLDQCKKDMQAHE